MLLPRRCHFAVHRFAFAVLATACVGLMTHAQESALPAGQDSYDAVSRATAGDSERFQRLAALYRAEFTEVAERTVVDGNVVLWISRSEKKSAADRQRVRDRLTALRSIPPDRLDPAARLDWRVLLSVTEADVELSRFPTEYASPDWPDNDLWWRLEAIPRNSIDDLRQRLAWLRGTPYAIEESLEQLQRGLARGVTASRDEVAATVQRLRELMPPDSLDSPYVVPFAKDLPDSIPEATKAEVLKQALTIYRNQIVPAYPKFLAFLEQTYLPKGRAAASLSTLPSGQQWYAAVVRRELGLVVTPDQVHEDAQTEVRRLTDEIERLAKSTGYQGSLPAFMADVRKEAS